MKIEEFDTWENALQSEKQLYDNWMTNKTPTWRIRYAANITENSKLFVRCLAKTLNKKATVLDLGSSGVPWFSYLCADAGMKVYSYDYQNPVEQQLLNEKGITYVHDDVNNLSRHPDILKDLNLIYCRGLSPAQKLRDWYDPVFTELLEELITSLSNDGLIYWIQMSTGSGIPSPEHPHFANHSVKYFTSFFKSRGYDSVLTKFGYIAIKFARHLGKPWMHYYIGDIESDVKDLLKEGDYLSLIKWFALQIQTFYKQTDYDFNTPIRITGPRIPARIIQILLENNFLYKHLKIIDETTDIQILTDDDISFKLSTVGPHHLQYFLIDEQEDRRFVDEYLVILQRYL